MLFYKFKDFEEFKELCGRYVMNNGEQNRRNKILLNCLKNKTFFKECIVRDFNGIPLDINSFASVENWVYRQLKFYSVEPGYYYIRLKNGITLPSTQFVLDDRCGLTADEDMHCIRYRHAEDNSLYKIKAGKFLKRCINDTPLGDILPEQLQRQIEESFSRNWMSFCEEEFHTDYKLVVSDEMSAFEDIYDSNICIGDFGSCMVDDDQYTFYHDAVKSKAAYIKDRNGNILARCIVFTDVFDCHGNKYRLAERQYASDEDNSLKQILVNKLIAAGEIDGYKKVGVDCRSSRAFVSKDGEDWYSKEFHIECNLESGDTMSYQDSFKWYDYDNNIAYNFEAFSGMDALDDTDAEFRHYERYWSEYNECYIDEIDACYDPYREDYFYASQVEVIDGEWIFKDDTDRCPECGKLFRSEDGYYSELTEVHYCCEACLDRAEREYKAENWYYSDFDDEFYENEEDVVDYNYFSSCGLWLIRTIHIDSIDDSFEEIDDEYYLVDSDEARASIEKLKKALSA